MSSFLETEYKECLSLLKYYDERHQSLVKFAAGLSSGIPSLLMGIYGLKNINQDVFWDFAFFISMLTTIGLLTIFVVMIQNRLYFVYPARQVNALRKHLLFIEESMFNDNQMYLTTNINAFKLFSTQTLLNLFVCFQIGIFAALSLFGYCIDICNQNELIRVSVILGMIIVFVVFTVSSYYLNAASKHHPDRSIHRQQC